MNVCRHQADAMRHALMVMSITPQNPELPIESGQEISKAFLQSRASDEATPVLIPEDVLQIGSTEPRSKENREQNEGRIEYHRPKAAFAFPLVAVCSPRNAGTGGSGNQPRTGGGSKSRS